MGMLMGIGNSNVIKITLKNADGTAAGTIGITKAGKKKQKRLQYNFKEISAQIMRAKTSGTARQVMSRARSMAAMLRKKLKSGEYDAKELENAIIHAEQMEKIAKKRAKHLQEEEEVKRGNGLCQAELDEQNEEFRPENAEKTEDFDLSSEELKELMQELQDAMEEWEEENGLEELSGEVHKDMDPADLELLKKKHRSDELRDIMKADMKYLKALFEKLEKEKQEAASGVALELAGAEMPVVPPEPPVAKEGGSIDVSV